MRFVLMHQERQVLEFDVDFATGNASIVRPLECFSYAPHGIREGNPRNDWLLRLFVKDRRISSLRVDANELLRATGARTLLELAFAAGGFSLYDQYWYKEPGSTRTWEDGNFFSNDWDLTFGEAVLRKDYDLLREASVATPDVTLGGACRKAWRRDARGPLLVKADDSRFGTNAVGETLTSRMLARLLPRGEYVTYELQANEGVTCTACRPAVGEGEDLITAWHVLLAVDELAQTCNAPRDVRGPKLLEKIRLGFELLDVKDGPQFATKAAVIQHLFLNTDVHPHNICLVHRADGHTLRPAPFLDFNRVLGLSDRRQMEWVTAHEGLAAMFVLKSYSNLDSSWDYTWYDPHALDDFEGEIEATLSACDGLPAGYAQCAARLFAVQRSYVNGVVAMRA